VSVAAQLAQDVESRAFQLDAAQQTAAAALDRLRTELIAAPRRYGFWRQRAIRWLPRHSALTPVRGLYLWGGVGRGKSYLMDRFFDALPFAERERSHFYRFMQDVHAGLASVRLSANPLEIVAHRIAKRTRLICFDEFFVSDIADAMILAGLFTGLFRRGVTLVCTSNSPPQELYRGGLQRQRFLPAIALIEQHVATLHVDGGTDYRLRQLESAGTYLDSGEAGSEARLQRAFERMTTHSARVGVSLAIAGHPIRVEREADGIAWFTFRELCEGPRSQADYIQIAREYHTVIISRVPRFGEADEDAARRFIMLIDELYDRSVKLLVSAAAEPAELYGGERLRLEFERAASRLVEMRTREYLAREHRTRTG
jgi:cell division protein ZapE